MNMFKKNGGFTLVELIVVIAILAILAGVAVPVYSGYISKAQEANDMTQLDSVKTAIFFSIMEDHPTAKVTEMIVTYGTNGITATADYTCTDAGCTTKTFSDVAVPTADLTALGVNTVTTKSGASKATWTSESAKWVLTPATGDGE